MGGADDRKDEHHAQVIQYLSFLKETLRLEVTFKERVKYLRELGQERFLALYPYTLHHNSYCMAVKDHPALFARCLAMHRKIIERGSSMPSVAAYGACHAGVGEYTVPVLHADDGVIAYINIGCFRGPRPGFEYAHERLLRKVAAAGREELTRSYRELPEREPYAADEIVRATAILKGYLLDCYNEVKQIKPSLPYMEDSFREHAALSKIIPYIRDHYTEDIRVADLAALSNYSESYLNHTFKKQTGINLRGYINWLRIERAKALLKTRGKGGSFRDGYITALAMELGFSSPEYFSRVFARMTGVIPSEYGG